MRRFAALLLWTFPMACHDDPEETPAATAEFADGEGRTVGFATLIEDEGGLRVTLRVVGLAPGRHGFHFHEHKDPKKAGPHFNPFGRKHGKKNKDGPHAGDLPNLEADAFGVAEGSVVSPLVTLRPGPHSIVHGAAVVLVIHAHADDEETDPDGNSGPPVATGVLRVP